MYVCMYFVCMYACTSTRKYRCTFHPFCFFVPQPPPAAWHLEGVSPGGVPFSLDGELAGVPKFWGTYVEILCPGSLHLKLPRTNEVISWGKANLLAKNVIIGNVWIDLVGEVRSTRVHGRRHG